MKDWYKLRNVEYSTKLDFFIKNQIFINRSGHSTSFNSLLESYCFDKINSLNYTGELDKNDIDIAIKSIHTNLLKGKYGKGEFIN